MLDSSFPRVELMEANSEPAMIKAFARSIERARPAESRLVRVHDFLWLRMWLRPVTSLVPGIESVQDLICSIGMH